MWTRLIFNRKTQEAGLFYSLMAVGLTLNHRLLLKTHIISYTYKEMFLKARKGTMLWLLWGFCLLVFLLGKQPILLLHVTKNKQMGGKEWGGRGGKGPFLSGKAIKICCITNYPRKNTNKHKVLLQLERPGWPPASWAQGHRVLWAAGALSFTKPLWHYKPRNVSQPGQELHGTWCYFSQPQSKFAPKKTDHKVAKRAGIYHSISCHPSMGDRPASDKELSDI